MSTSSNSDLFISVGPSTKSTANLATLQECLHQGQKHCLVKSNPAPCQTASQGSSVPVSRLAIFSRGRVSASRTVGSSTSPGVGERTSQLPRPPSPTCPPTSWKSIGQSCQAETLPTDSIHNLLESRLDNKPQSVKLSRQETTSIVSGTQPKYVKSRLQRPQQSYGEAPFTSNEATPHHSVVPQSGRRERTHEVILPEPEIAYAQPFYFTQCPHVSPPASRPLNVSPKSVPFGQTLLSHVREELASRAKEESFEIYVLDGRCCHCDLAARRQAEGLVLDQYTVEVDKLSTTLDALKEKNVDLNSNPCNPQDEKLTQEMVEGILKIENALTGLIHKRDKAIKRTWHGYTKRWGPATILDRDTPSQSQSRRSGDEFGANPRRPQPGTTRSCRIDKTCLKQEASPSSSSSMLPTRSRSYVITSSGSDTSSRGSGITCASLQSSNASSTQASSVTMGSVRSMECQQQSAHGSDVAVMDTPASRYSDGRRPLAIPSPIDRVRGHGRVKLDWVRRG